MPDTFVLFRVWRMNWASDMIGRAHQYNDYLVEVPDGGEIGYGDYATKLVTMERTLYDNETSFPWVVAYDLNSTSGADKYTEVSFMFSGLDYQRREFEQVKGYRPIVAASPFASVAFKADRPKGAAMCRRYHGCVTPADLVQPSGLGQRRGNLTLRMDGPLTKHTAPDFARMYGRLPHLADFHEIDAGGKVTEGTPTIGPLMPDHVSYNTRYEMAARSSRSELFRFVSNIFYRSMQNADYALHDYESEYFGQTMVFHERTPGDLRKYLARAHLVARQWRVLGQLLGFKRCPVIPAEQDNLTELRVNAPVEFRGKLNITQNLEQVESILQHLYLTDELIAELTAQLAWVSDPAFIDPVARAQKTHEAFDLAPVVVSILFNVHQMLALLHLLLRPNRQLAFKGDKLAVGGRQAFYNARSEAEPDKVTAADVTLFLEVTYPTVYINTTELPPNEAVLTVQEYEEKTRTYVREEVDPDDPRFQLGWDHDLFMWYDRVMRRWKKAFRKLWEHIKREPGADKPERE